MNSSEVTTLGQQLYLALQNRTPIDPISDRFPDMSLQDAYKISLEVLGKRTAGGEKVIGKKIGLTSLAVQQMLKVDQPDFGFLTDNMLCHDNVPLAHLIQPKAEGEIAFLLKSDLKGPGITEEDVLQATEAVMPCFEVVDSRIKNWKIKIQDTIADNASCGLFAINLNAKADPQTVDFVNCKMVVKKNGEFLSSGTGSAALGNPLTCVAWLANTLSESGISLLAGDIILSGSLVPLEAVVIGDNMSVEIDGIGALEVSFT